MGGVVVAGASEGGTAVDWLLIGLFVLVVGACVLVDLPPMVGRAVFAITVIVAVNLAGRFDAPPAQIGSAVLVMIAWLVGTTAVLLRIRATTRQQ